jgi:hypothetical protein
MLTVPVWASASLSVVTIGLVDEKSVRADA